MRILENDDEKLRAIEALSVKYAPNNSCEQKNAEIEKFWNALTMLEFTVEHMSGKEAIELKRMNGKQ